MEVSYCIDNELRGNKPHSNYNSLTAYSLEERELLMSIAKLLYKTKSVRKVIEVIDKIDFSTNKTYIHENNGGC